MYKGQLKGFPKEVVKRMLECQEEQGNKRDVSVFEMKVGKGAMDGGFDWGRTKEKSVFWSDVINYKMFKTFFKKYPKKQEYPKVMFVSNKPILEEFAENKSKRVVFLEKNSLFFAWNKAETLDEAEEITSFASWKYAKDIPVPVEMTVEEIEEKLGLEKGTLIVK